MARVSEAGAPARKRVDERLAAGLSGFDRFLTFGYSIAWVQMERGKKPQQECQYGLLPALLDGMLESAQGRTRVIDGCELAYSYKQPQQFERMYQTMKTNLLPIVAAPNKYASVMSLGFGLWLDYDSHKRKWELNDLDKNYFTPEQFKASVTTALNAADEYVWIYTEQPRWWSGSGATNLPAAYVQALKDARGTGPRSTTSKPQ